jgi:hypothetical protein
VFWFGSKNSNGLNSNKTFKLIILSSLEFLLKFNPKIFYISSEFCGLFCKRIYFKTNRDLAEVEFSCISDSR